MKKREGRRAWRKRMTLGAVRFLAPKATLETLKSKPEMPSAADVLGTLEKQKCYVDDALSCCCFLTRAVPRVGFVAT
jgi:hypothetical protein